ncbi:D-amino-acid oxidase [Coccidioides immitis RMSCC 2394]|uniref:D-amino-acid oxidase n=1 Tax=Coccidioides immitis RMSCC 2394 TaxID=404692 RepID=A0A0J7AZI4_COCIT|nr:D-amino-acid oxidase [Coccidioides immitis RMSCC 2394]
MARQERKTIVVVGAGVLGLSSALTLLKTLPSSKYQILLVASYFSSDGPHPSYPSTAAGAHYRPIPATTPQLKYEAGLAKITCDRFKKLASEHPEYGIKFMEGIEYISGEVAPVYKALPPEYTQLDGFRVLNDDEKPPRVDFGARYETYTLDPEIYLAHLLRRYRLDGGEIKRMELASLQEAFEIDGYDVAMVVNCSGMGFGDPNTFIIRGQTCLVANTCDKTITRQDADGWSFLIPRPLEGGTIVGGTKQPNDWSSVPIASIRETLLEKAAKLYPAILNAQGKFDVIRDIVGRRPAREGGLRLEVETLPKTASPKRTVVHAYGAGGRGYELSWGIAEEVVRMVKDNLQERLHSRL